MVALIETLPKLLGAYNEDSVTGPRTITNTNHVWYIIYILWLSETLRPTDTHIYRRDAHTNRSPGARLNDICRWYRGIAGRIALLTGAYTRIASAMLLPVMLVALFTVHLPQGFSFMHVIGMTDSGPQFGVPGFEVNLIYISGLECTPSISSSGLEIHNKYSLICPTSSL